jgi:hypothetical protein
MIIFEFEILKIRFLKTRIFNVRPSTPPHEPNIESENNSQWPTYGLDHGTY